MPDTPTDSTYILCMRKDCAFLIGPFDNQDDAAKWADPYYGLAGDHPVSPNNPEDDPRWQTLQLSAERLAAPLPKFDPSLTMEEMAALVRGDA